MHEPILKCVKFRTLIMQDAGRKGQWRMLKWDRRMSTVEVLEVVFVGGLLCGEKESSENVAFQSVLSFFDLFLLWLLWVVS